MNAVSRRELLLLGASCACRAANLRLPDVPVTTHDSRQTTLPQLTAGREVAMQFIFTSCSTICPLLGSQFHQVQRALQRRRHTSSLLLSVSVDPQNDNSRRLRAFLSKHQAGPHWVAVRVEQPHLDNLLRAMDEEPGSPTLHSPQVLIFNRAGSCVKRLRELATPERVVEALISSRS